MAQLMERTQTERPRVVGDAALDRDDLRRPFAAVEELSHAQDGAWPERRLRGRQLQHELVARFQLEFLLSLTVKVNAVLCSGKFPDNNLATLDDKLNVLTGNLDRPGGTMFTRPAVTVLDRLSPGRHDRWRSRVRDLPEFSGELPVSVLTEEITTATTDTSVLEHGVNKAALHPLREGTYEAVGRLLEGLGERLERAARAKAEAVGDGEMRAAVGAAARAL